jgi:hypothetical protein
MGLGRTSMPLDRWWANSSTRRELNYSITNSRVGTTPCASKQRQRERTYLQLGTHANEGGGTIRFLAHPRSAHGVVSSKLNRRTTDLRISARQRCISSIELATCRADVLPPVSFVLRKRSSDAFNDGPYLPVQARNLFVALRRSSSCRCIRWITLAAPSRSNTRPSCTPMSTIAPTSVWSKGAAVSDENSSTARTMFPSRTEKPTERVSPALVPCRIR